MGDRKVVSVVGVAVCALLLTTGKAGAQDSGDPMAGDMPPAEAPMATAPAAAPSAAPAMPAVDADPEPAPNAIYGEVLGAGLFYSINYERHVNADLAVRIGVSYTSFSATASSGSSASTASSSYLTLPITVSYVGLRGLEVGGGATLTYTSGSASTGVSSASGSGVVPLGTVLLGYRSHPMGRAGFQFRVGAMALIGKGLSLSSDATPDDIGVLPWIYISFGAGF